MTSEAKDDHVLKPGCKMRFNSVYASDLDCTVCGRGEGEACPEYEAASPPMTDHVELIARREVEWQTMETAPKRAPVTVWASLDPSDPLMTWREFTASDRFGLGDWRTLGRRSLRVWPTHWKPLSAPGAHQ